MRKCHVMVGPRREMLWLRRLQVRRTFFKIRDWFKFVLIFIHRHSGNFKYTFCTAYLRQDLFQLGGYFRSMGFQPNMESS